MEIRVRVSTNKIGSESEDMVEIDEEELNGLTLEEQEKYIQDIALERMFQLIEWDWEKVD